MGEVRTLRPRPDAPSRHVLTTAETWDLLLTGLRAAHVTMGNVIGSIEAEAPPVDTFAMLARLDTQIHPLGPLIIALLGAEHAAEIA